MRVWARSGFTVAEATVAVVVLSVGLLALAGSMALAGRMIGVGRQATRVGQAAAARVERMRQVALSTVPACGAPEWRSELDQALLPGGYFKEFVFFHRGSRTLIVTDAVINIELEKMDEPWRTFTRISGMYHPRGQVFFGIRLPLLLQRTKAAATFAKIRSWQPRRILLSHGRCFESGADEAIHRMFGEQK